MEPMDEINKERKRQTYRGRITWLIATRGCYQFFGPSFLIFSLLLGLLTYLPNGLA